MGQYIGKPIKSSAWDPIFMSTQYLGSGSQYFWYLPEIEPLAKNQGDNLMEF